MKKEIYHVYDMSRMGPASLNGFGSLINAFKDCLIYGDRQYLLFKTYGDKVRVTDLNNSSVCYDFYNSDLYRIVSIYDDVVGMISDFDNTMITFTISYNN